MWTDFFVATTGASAALAGLVFVALSVNIDRILHFTSLPSRAAMTVGMLMLLLVCSMSALIHQPTATFGAEVIGFGICAWLMTVWASWKSIAARRREHRPWYEAAFVVGFGHAQIIPILVGGALLASGHEGGVSWIAGACFAIVVVSMWSTWILLVEIRR